MPAAWKNVCCIVLLLSGKLLTAKAQSCKPDVFSILYEGNAAYNNFQTIENPQNDIISVGSVLQVNGGFAYDAWAYKLSPRGTVLWAKRYMPAGYNSGYFNSIVALPDGGYLVSGHFSYLKRRFPDNQTETIYSLTMIGKLDQYGNLVWMKMLLPYRTYFSTVNALTLTSNGDIVGTLDVFGTNFNGRFFFRMDQEANVKWCTQQKVGNIKTGSVTFKERRNGQLLVSGWAYKTNLDNPLIEAQGFYLMTLNPDNGRAAWSQAYYFTKNPQSSFLSTASVPQISEMDNGNIVLFSSYSDTTNFILPPYTRKGLMLTTFPGGTFQKAIGYENGKPGCAIADAKQLPGDRFLLLLNDTHMPLLAEVDREGMIAWHRGYGNVNGNLKAASVYVRPDQLQIYSSGRNEVAMSNLMQTESKGELACMETPSQLVSRDVSESFTEEAAGISTETENLELFETTLLGLNRWAYSHTIITSCVISCCTNIGSDTTSVALCNQPYYQLPDGTRATGSGVYYQRHKTSNGCDSIAYYNVQLDQSPHVNLGEDLCLEGKDSLVLNATAGFEQYNWMGMTSSDSTFTVNTPGLYWVSVANHCGNARDTVHVYQDCDFPVHMPNAFTPNGDGKNDVFRYPPLAKNKFIRLTIFNRWGEKLFETREAAKGWNGKLKGILQPVDSYIYLLETQTLDGRKQQHKGTVTLIR
ncbi:MAG TPA: gliding motility-associated C-terminal domain-containing protein [Flavisolibacter sp.]|jgi:gliding motility-associated-like protein|nr:gliding motility-associated C-terminal domain-containing protein [Flavisolibacter sp.]